MQLVIDIPEEDYEIIKSGSRMVYSGMRSGKTFLIKILEVILNAIPLPKGHGRLIDADVLADGFEDNYEFCEVVNATPTIIEADKGDKE